MGDISELRLVFMTDAAFVRRPFTLLFDLVIVFQGTAPYHKNSPYNFLNTETSLDRGRVKMAWHIHAYMGTSRHFHVVFDVRVLDIVQSKIYIYIRNRYKNL